MPELRTVIAARVALTSDDLAATIPSGASLFANRLHWAITYMYQGGLVRRPRRGVVQITDRGREVLAKHPDRVGGCPKSRRTWAAVPVIIRPRSRFHHDRRR